MGPIQRIAVVGGGAMGAFYATRFFDVDPSCVSLVADGERCERLRDQGLVVNGRSYAVPVLRPGDTAPPSDLVLVAVKNHHMDQALRDMQSRVGEHTVFLSVMNGIDSEEQLGRAFGMEKVLYAVALGIDSVREENRVTYTTPGVVHFGEAENREISERVRRVQELFDRAEIPWETPEDMIRTLWWKFMINVGVNQSSAVLRAPYGVFQRSQEARDLMEAAMWEVIAVAERAGVSLNGQDTENWKTVLFTLGPEGKTSMLQDIEAGRKTEVEIFSGRVLELGETYDVPVPVNRVLFQILKAMETQQGSLRETEVP
jgi:2-dehydropantoate 2-reductase